MTTATLQRVREFGPTSAGTRMTPREFDRSSFIEDWRYELIQGVLIVSPIPSLNERDPNEQLGHLLRAYKETHPQGSSLNFTTYEHTVRTVRNRRRADRVIWAGLGRLPRKNEMPTLIVEFVSAGKRDRRRDYDEKRDEYLEIGVKEYWVIDRFRHTLTVFTRRGGKVRRRVVPGNETYTSNLLPGFVLPLNDLLTLADRWPDDEPEAE